MTEWSRGGIPDAVDLMVTQSTLAAIEFKFPREPCETNAAWTQHLGEVLKDFCRLAALSAEVGDLWRVRLLSRRIRRYLDGVNDRYNLRIGSVAGELTRIDPTQVAGLPTTALRMLRRWMDMLPVLEARCAAVRRVGVDLCLVVHTVQQFTSTTDVAAMTSGIRSLPTNALTGADLDAARLRHLRDGPFSPESEASPPGGRHARW